MLSNQAKCQRENGFTLLEMMIAIAIFAVLSLSAFTVMRQMLLSDERLDEKTVRLTAINQALLQMEQDFTSIVPKMARVGYDREREGMLVSIKSRTEANDEIYFTRNSWFNPGLILQRSELVRVGYLLEDGNLVREYYTFVDRVPNAEAKRRIVLTDVNALKFRYLYRNQWISDWQDKERLPDAIEMTLTSEQDGVLTRQFKLNSAVSEQD
ncbi:type II secretion system minor pseudopilin GspJ [Thorsellia anophelis]|uniref:Type II secretion system protein J n=1 Tax=Thorsellia anophelis DSM 18579 TaxID=1123402 RepID=A0A1I0AV01_9GAMM|nr:type II secretion system minor pseudopilin GspJ [Thorsellia anophelis]SES98273.1 general secretion pathway protein J [Thorsellia anophelis DSM 18579]